MLRQLGEMWPDDFLAGGRPRALVLAELLGRYAVLLNCEVKALHLDHDPALGSREKVFRKGVHVGYKPDANDPEHLYYREATAHRLKTNVRGEHGQHPDRVLIKKQRRLERGPKPKKGGRIRQLIKWPKRPLKSASRWPKGRKIQNRRKP